MTRDQKKGWGFLSFLPLLLFTAWSVYFIVITEPLINNGTYQNHFELVGLVTKNYDGLLIILSLALLVSAVILLLFTVHITRLKNINGGTKLAWMVFMVVFGAFAFPVFWYNVLRLEPADAAIYSSIE